MNTKLLALGLVAGSLGFAQDDGKMDNTTESTSGCCTSCCAISCTCCTPKPQKCIDCECYTPKWYDMSCDCGWFLSVDFLYWYGREDHTSYAARAQTVQVGTSAGTGNPVYAAITNKLEYLSDKWSPGFRIGLGWLDECDGWDMFLSWTYYHNNKSGSTSVDPFTGVFAEPNGYALVNPWVNIAVADELAVFEWVAAEWEFSFNSIDWEFGRRYWLSRCFTMRPFVAVRAAWTDTNFDLVSLRQDESANPSSPSTASEADYVYKDRFHNCNWGVGFVTGFQPTWFFTPSFSLYGSADIALLWGQRDLKKTENYAVVRTLIATGALSGSQIDYDYTSSGSEYSGMQPMLDLALGLRWENYFCMRRYHLAIDCGWEHHVLFDHNFRFKTEGRAVDVGTLATGDLVSGFQSYDETLHNVYFGGFVLRVTFGF